MEQSGTSLRTLGIYVTTKYVIGSEPKIFDADKKDTWIIGASREFADIVIPDPYISRVNAQISFYNDVWRFVYLGENKCYYSSNGSDFAKLFKGQSVVLEQGSIVYFLFRQPKYALEFFPGMEKNVCDIGESKTESGNSLGLGDLQYIDSFYEFLTYLIYTLTHASFWRFLFLLAALVLIAWIIYG